MESPAVPSLRARVARAISIALHPFLTLPVAIFLASRTLALGSRITGIIIATLAVSLSIVGALVILGVRRGTLTNVDVSDRRQRPVFYAVITAATCGCAWVFWVLDLPQIVIRGALISVGLLVASWMVNYLLKCSLHVGYTVFSLAIAWQSLPEWGRAFGAGVCLLMMWSRVEMRRHTLSETIAGAVLGSIAGFALNSPPW